MNAHDLSKLRRIGTLIEKLIASGESQRVRALKAKANRKRIRRTGKELIEFRKLLKAERRKGVPVAEIAKKHGVTPAYVYMLP